MVPPPAATAKMEQIFLFCALIEQRREIADQNVDRVLLVLDVLVQATALMSDFEEILSLTTRKSCLALRYEALVLRDAKSAIHQWLEVGRGEWLRFAENAIDYGFHHVARKACHNALLCLGKNGMSDTQVVPILDEEGVSKLVERLRSIALSSMSSCSGKCE